MLFFSSSFCHVLVIVLSVYRSFLQEPFKKISVSSLCLPQLLEEICSMGQDPKYICQKQQPKSEQSTTSPRSPQPVDGGSSEEEEEEEDIPSASSSSRPASSSAGAAAAATAATASSAVSSASAKSTSLDSVQ